MEMPVEQMSMEVSKSFGLWVCLHHYRLVGGLLLNVILGEIVFLCLIAGGTFFL